MLTHKQVWEGIDQLAARNHLSASGLAKRSGLDPTTFNKSKRTTKQGKARWPSTESISKILDATSTSMRDFVEMMHAADGRAARSVSQRLKCIRLADLEQGAGVDASGFPGEGPWEEIDFPSDRGRSRLCGRARSRLGPADLPERRSRRGVSQQQRAPGGPGAGAAEGWRAGPRAACPANRAADRAGGRAGRSAGTIDRGGRACLARARRVAQPVGQEKGRHSVAAQASGRHHNVREDKPPTDRSPANRRGSGGRVNAILGRSD